MPLSKGKEFEKHWKESWEKTPHYFLRLQDSAKWTSDGKTSFTPSNPYDGLAFASPILFTMELKSVEGTGISFNPGDPTKRPTNEKTHVMIKASQVKSLLACHEKIGVVSGFIFNFRPRVLKTKTEPNETFFVFIDDFIRFAVQSGKSSIGRNDCRDIGIPITGEVKKVHFKYDIDEFVFQATNMLFSKKPLDKETMLLQLGAFIQKYK